MVKVSGKDPVKCVYWSKLRYLHQIWIFVSNTVVSTRLVDGQCFQQSSFEMYLQYLIQTNNLWFINWELETACANPKQYYIENVRVSVKIVWFCWYDICVYQQIQTVCLLGLAGENDQTLWPHSWRAWKTQFSFLFKHL